MKLAIIYAAIGCWSILAVSCGGAQDSSTVSRNVKVITPEPMGGTITHEFNGVLEEARKADLSFRVGGPVIGVFAEEGDFVKQEALLAVIDPRDYQVQHRAAEAHYLQAKGEYDRFKELFEQGKLPTNTFEKLEAAYLAAKSSFDRASHALDDTRLTAPFSGTIYTKSIQKHETASPGTMVFTLIDVNDLEVVFGVPESLVSQLANQKETRVQIGSLSIPATIKSVAGKSGEDNLFEVRLNIKNPDINEVRPGMNARVFVEINSDKRTGISVPVEAVFYQKGEPAVWIFDEKTQTIASRNIKSGHLLSGGRMQIIEGLDGHEKVVTAGVHSLFEQQKVRAMN